MPQVWTLLAWLGEARTQWVRQSAFDLPLAYDSCPDAPTLFCLALAADVDWKLVLLAACDCAQARFSPAICSEFGVDQAACAVRSFVAGEQPRDPCDYLEMTARQAADKLRHSRIFDSRLLAAETARNLADAAHRVQCSPRSQDAASIAGSCAGDEERFASIVRTRIPRALFLDAAQKEHLSSVWDLFRALRFSLPSVDWALPYESDLKRAFQECPCAAWLLRMAESLGADHSSIVRSAMACVQEALVHFKPNRDDPEAHCYFDDISDHAKRAIAIAECWLDGSALDAGWVDMHQGHSHLGMASCASKLVAGVARLAYPSVRPSDSGPSLFVEAVADATVELYRCDLVDAGSRLIALIRPELERYFA